MAPEALSPTVQIDYASCVNLAMQQNDVPLLRALRVHNTANTATADLTLRLETSPPLSAPWSLRLGPCPPGAAIDIAPERLRLQLSRDRLVNQEERERGELRACLEDASGTPLGCQAWPLDILACNEWDASTTLREILAAFVMPNHPAVSALVRQACDQLAAGTGQAGILAYQNPDRDRIRREVAALYAALVPWQIAYVNPPPSFEKTGQKIRTPDQIAEYRLGTCLDLAVMLAAAFEQAGLAPLLVLQRHHAFVGAWVDDDAFEKPVVDSALAIRKRVDLGEIVVIETTGLCAHPATAFTNACQTACRQLDNTADFLYALDVRMARHAGIRPLVARSSTARCQALPENPTPATPGAPDRAAAAAPVTPAAAPATTAEAPEPVEPSRLERWKRRLLDLSRRNPLLNFRQSRRAIPIDCPAPAALEDALASGEAFAILPRPTVMAEADPRDRDAHRDRTGQDALEAFLQAQMARHRLHTPLAPEDLDRRLLEVSRADRLSLEESGAHTLFMALGFLRWYDSERSPDANLAPIILIPMAIERGSVRDGFRLRMLDDEPRINITLLEKLKADFGIVIEGLDPLPMDDAGLDVPAILRRCREAVKTIERWQVEETCALAILTFTRFVMWLDLEQHHDRLRESPIVRHLLETPGEAFPAAPVTVDADALDRQLRPVETFCPLDADASQLAAVVVADQGHSFVLQGPPGTGKSQTIANLMAHAMTRGRRVLFVSEKMAALEVVQRRLEALGLGPFCLELHSRKATRSDVRQQLEEALRVERHLEPPEWPGQTDRLEAQRAALNAWVEALHRPRPFGQTAWWAINRMICHGDLPDLTADLGSLAAMTPERAEAAMLAARQAQTAAEAVDLRPDHPLRDVGRSTWTLGLEDQLALILERLDQTADALSAAAKTALYGLQITGSHRPWGALTLAASLADCLRQAPPLTAAMVEAADWPATRDGLRDLIAQGRERDDRRQRLEALYTEGVLGLPIETLRQRLALAQSRGTLRRWWGTTRVRARLKAFSRQPKALTATAMADHLDNAIALNRLDEALAAADDLTRLFGSSWRQGRPDWDLLQTQVDWVERFRAVRARDACLEPAAAAPARGLWTALATDQHDRVVPEAPLGVALAAFLEAMQAFQQAWSATQNDLCLAVGDNRDSLLGAPDCLDAVRAATARWRAGRRDLRSWCAWKAARTRAAEAGMESALQAVEAGTTPVGRLAALAEKAFARWGLREILAQDPVLGEFHGPEHNRRIEAFRDLDEQVRRLTAATVFAQLSQRLPHQGADIERFRSSQMGTLKRIAKGARFTIRQIFADCPEALARLKPCVFMSPLSVAQFLGADFPKFDMVVFDEASQMPPWEAIGAIARGNQAVVVGDSKQLPPTSFFEKTAAEEDAPAISEEDVEDLESILDECVACQMPTRSLTWHYRSRHESLIAFSNRHYYGDALSTFPSPVDDADRLGLSLHPVEDGFYDAGRSRTNRREAEALVAEVVRRLADPAERQRSIGVVTFSMAQQGLVEDLLEQARRDHPEIEPAFTDQGTEPLFVKNLETVQGDERDVIFFSICYGPNRQGVVSMNFGPLNRKGGERRLNVAITRARQQLVVVSTLRPEQIDLERTTAIGVRHLQAFLAFAANGARTPSAAADDHSRGATLPPVEQSIREALEQRGWQVRGQVGCSAYRVDLAVVHPDRPGAFLLGIECDGTTYRSARTARDRDRIRQAVLRGLGWRLTRVWALDWWLEREREIARLQHDLEQALAASRHDAATTEPPDPDPATGPAAPPATAQSAAAPKESIVDENRDGRPDLPGQRLYRRAPARRRGVAAALTGPGNDHAIRTACAEVLAAEAPVDADLLARRVAADWGVARLTAGLRQRVLGALPPGTRLTETPSGRAFVWNADQDPDRYDGFRVHDPADGPVRDIEQICPQEVANLMEALLQEHLSIHRDDLVRAAAAALGQDRLGARIRQSLEEGLALLEQRQGSA